MNEHKDAASAREPIPPFSLLRLSALARLGGALVLIAALWGAVSWALH